MKKIFALLVLSISCSALAQTCVPGNGVTCSPNLNMWLLPYAYPAWNVPVNANTTILDTSFGNTLKLNVTSPQTMAGPLITPMLTISGFGPSASPVCPNGAGGSLTIAGCTGSMVWPTNNGVAATNGTGTGPWRTPTFADVALLWASGACGSHYMKGDGTCDTGPSSGFPITLGSTSVAAGSTTTSLAGLTINGVVLSTAGPSTSYLDKTGSYSVPAGSSGISGGTSGQLAVFGSATTITSGIPVGNTGSDIPQLSSGLLSSSIIPAINLAGTGAGGVMGQLPIGSVGSIGLSGTSPIVVASSGAISCPTCSTGTGTNVEVNGGSALATANFNGTTPAAGASNINVAFQTSTTNVSAEVPYATNSTFGVIEPGSGCSVTAGVLTCSGGSSLNLIPVENYSATPYSTTSAATSGTDSLSDIQACLNALTPGQACLMSQYYRITGTLTMPTTIGIGLVGLSQGSSGLVSTSASADKIDAWGTSLSVRLTYDTFANFSTYRSVTPTGTSAGISQKYTGGTIINGVANYNDTYPEYVLGAAAFGTGYIANTESAWTVTPPVGSCGFYLDGTTGVALDSFRMRNVLADASVLGNHTEVDGVCLAGTLISDVTVVGFEAAVPTYGIKITGSGSANQNFQDIHFDGSILDECLTACIYVSGIPAVSGSSSGITFNGGFAGADNVLLWGYAPYTAEIISSSGVNISNMQLQAGSTATVYLNGSSGNILANNTINSATSLSGSLAASGILANNSTDNTITSNSVYGSVNDTQTLIKFTGSSGNTVQSNVVWGRATKGMSFDATSNNNLWLTSNSIDTTNIGTAFTDAGTGNQQPTFSYPGAGIANSTGSAWGTSYTVGNSGSDIPQLSSGLLAVSILPVATNSTFGVVEPDTTTITQSAGVLSAAVGNVTGTSPIVVTPSGTTFAVSCPTCGTSTASSVTINGGSSLGTANFNGTTPAAAAGFVNGTWQVSSSNVSVEIPIPLSIVWAEQAGTTTSTVNQTLYAQHAGAISQCVVGVTTTDPSTALIFNVKQNGTSVLSGGAQTLAATSTGYHTYSLTSGSVSVAAGDIFALSFTTIGAAWFTQIGCN